MCAKRLLAMGLVFAPLATLFSMIDAAVAQPRAFVCEFTSRHSGTLKPAYVQERGQGAGHGLSITFASVDLTKGTAQMVGNAGAAPVTVLANEGRMHFVEVTDAGNLSVTSVFVLSRSGEQLPAVHSRHMALLGASAVVSQYTGTCTPRF
jgi:hypothetical protein